MNHQNNAFMGRWWQALPPFTRILPVAFYVLSASTLLASGGGSGGVVVLKQAMDVESGGGDGGGCSTCAQGGDSSTVQLNPSLNFSGTAAAIGRLNQSLTGEGSGDSLILVDDETLIAGTGETINLSFSAESVFDVDLAADLSVLASEMPIEVYNQGLLCSSLDEQSSMLKLDLAELVLAGNESYAVLFVLNSEATEGVLIEAEYQASSNMVVVSLHQF